MHILMLTPALPYPPHQGGALRNFGILRGLHNAGHTITLLSFADADANSPRDLEGTPLPELCARVETVATPPRSKAQRLSDLALTAQPDLARRLETPAFRERLRDVLAKTPFDLIQFEGLEMAIYLAQARQLQPAARLVYDAHNAEHALQQAIADVERGNRSRLPAALYSRVQAGRIANFERTICAQADAVIAVSAEDAAALRPFRPDGKIHVLANGIFADDYTASDQGVDLGSAALVFTGKMDYRPNVDAVQWFVSDILPDIRARCPDAHLYVVGQKPHASLQTLRADDAVEVTGWVDKVQPFLHAAQVYVAPLRMGSGTRLKILEAMASRCAVVATPAAVAGLDAETRAAVIVVEDAAGFADRVIRLLENPAERQALGKKAQAVARKHYDWSALIPGLLAIYQELGIG